MEGMNRDLAGPNSAILIMSRFIHLVDMHERGTISRRKFLIALTELRDKAKSVGWV